MKPTIYLLCLCFIGSKQVYGVSTKIYHFLSLFNGDWSNDAQTETPGDQHDSIRSRVIPVKVSVFKDPVLFMEEAVNGAVRMLLLGVVTESSVGSISMKLYNFTDITKYKPREYNVEDLSNVTLDDLQSDDRCVASFRMDDDNFAAGSFPNCRYTYNGTHPRYGTTVTCDMYIASFPSNIRQKSTIEPYILLPAGPKYRLIEPPKGHVSPCAGKVKTT